MRLDSTIDAITNSSSELFVFKTKSLDEVYDVLIALWNEYRSTSEAAFRVESSHHRYLLDDEDLRDIVVMGKDKDGFVFVREDEERLLEELGFGDVIRQHFGDLVSSNRRV